MKSMTLLKPVLLGLIWKFLRASSAEVGNNGGMKMLRRTQPMEWPVEKAIRTLQAVITSHQEGMRAGESTHKWFFHSIYKKNSG